jgi:hypothetical protein
MKGPLVKRDEDIDRYEVILGMICFERFCGLDDPTDKMLVPVGWCGEDKKRAHGNGTTKDTREEGRMTKLGSGNGRNSCRHDYKR